MIFSKIFKGVHLFKTAFNTTRHQIWVSVRLLTVITFFFAFLYVAWRKDMGLTKKMMLNFIITRSHEKVFIFFRFNLYVSNDFACTSSKFI